MNNNIVSDLLKTTVSIELENDCVIKDDCIEITLPDGKVATAIVVEMNSIDCAKINSVVHDNKYVFEHDYGEIGENRTNKLLLRNLQDVKDYAIDVVQTNLTGAIVFDKAVLLEDGSALQIVIEITA